MPDNGAVVRSLAALYEDVRRQRDGLRSERLSDRTLETIRDVDVVRRVSERRGMRLTVAFLEVTRAAADRLSVTDLLVVDAALALGIARERLAGQLPTGVRRLTAELVSQRRQALTDNWYELHQALGVPRPEATNQSKLRTQQEGPALEALARAVLQVRPEDFDDDDTTRGARPRVLVVGSAVMDVIFRVPHIPEAETSVQAHDFDLHPGGKGLTQAVAAARLGMEVKLAAAVGRDHFGDTILQYLEEEKVDTSLVQRYDAQTPVTCVIVLAPRKSSLALGWKNESGLHLNEDDVTRGAIGRAAANTDFLFVTFEPPVRTIESLLSGVRKMREDRPTVVLTPAPPYSNPPLPFGALGAVNYLMTNDWEARALLGEPEDSDVEEVVRHLLNAGVECVCMPVDRQVFVHRREASTVTIPAWPALVHDTAGSRDALCAATALQLWRHNGEFNPRIVRWAAAAMATSASMKGVPDSMPTEDEVERFIKQHKDDFPTPDELLPE